MKRLLCAFLCALLALQSLPMEALADSSSLILSAEELNAAIRQAGFGEDAAPYHAGMRASRVMTANQAVELLTELIEHDMDSLLNAAQDIEVRAVAEGMADSDPAMVYLRGLRTDMSALMDRLIFMRDELNAYGRYIGNNQHILTDPDYRDKERVQYSLRVREAQDKMDAYLAGIASPSGYPLWTQQIRQWRADLGISINDGEAPPEQSNDYGAAELFSLLDEYARDTAVPDEKPLQTHAASNTLLNRLRGASPASVYVLRDDAIGVRMMGTDGVTVTVQDTHAPYGKRTLTPYGTDASFEVKHFTPDESGHVEVDITAEKQGWRTVKAHGVRLLKGGICSISMVKDDGRPYIMSAEFNGKNIFTEELGVYMSQLNDAEHTIRVTVVAPNSGASYTARLIYTDLNQQTVIEERANLMGAQSVDFTGQWLRLFKPDQPVIVELETAAGKERFPLQLNVQRGPLDAPLYDATHRMSFIPDIGGLGVTLPSGLPPVIAGSTLSLDFFKTATPQLYVDMAGSIYFSLGVNEISDKLAENNKKWKTQDSRDLDRARENVSKDGLLQKAFTDLYAWKDGNKTFKHRLLGSASADVSLFMVLQARYIRQTESQGLAKGQIMGGLSVNFSTEFTYAFMPLIYGSLGLSATVSAALTLGMEADATWPPNGELKLEKLRLDTGTTGMSVQLRIQISATVGVGIKDVLCVSITGYGYINILVMFAQNTYVKIDIGAGIMLQAKILFVKWYSTIMSIDKTLLDTRNKHSLRAAQPALREGGGEVKTGLSDYNPDLEAPVYHMFDNPSVYMPRMKFVQANGTTYGFYIAPDDQGLLTLHWAGITADEDGQNVTDVGSLRGWLNGQDAAFSQALAHQYDFDVTVRSVLGEDVIFVGLLGTEQMIDVPVTLEDGTQSTRRQPDPSACYAAYVTLCYDENNQRILPAMSGVDKSCQPLGGYYVSPLLHVKDTGDNADCEGLMTVNVAEGMAAVPQKAFALKGSLHTANFHNEETSLANIYAMAQGKNIETLLTADTRMDSRQFAAFYLETLPGGGKQLVHKTTTDHIAPLRTDQGSLGPQVLDSGNILSMHMLGETGGNEQRVFYLKQDSDSPDEYRLFGATAQLAESGGYRYLTQAVVTDYDVTMPSADYRIQTIGTNDYIYWLETISPENPGDPTRYRVAAVLYDRANDAVSYKVTLAILPGKSTQVAVDAFEGKALASLYLEAGSEDPNADQQYGYFLAWDQDAADNGISLYSFPTKMSVDVSIEAMSTKYTMVSAGEYNELLFTLRNVGTVPVSSLDLDMRIQPQSGGRWEDFQKLHVSFTDATQNYNVDGNQKPASGDPKNPEGVYRILGFNDDFNGDQWLQKRTTYSFTTGGGQTTQTTLLKTPLLMPGGIACFKAALRIPADWTGENNIGLAFGSIGVHNDWEATLMDAAKNAPLTRRSSGAQAAQSTAIVTLASQSDSMRTPARILNTSSGEDLVLDHRIYTHNGERMLEMNILNRSVLDSDSHHTELRAYDDTGAMLFDSCLGEDVADGRTHTVALPLALLLGGADPRELTVEVEVQNDSDINIINNSFTLRLRDDTLVILQQPQDLSVLAGETAVFAVRADGGALPYSYQWQRRASESAAWQAIDGATGAALTLPNAAQAMNGWQVRCIVTDGSYDRIASAVATLAVTVLPPTGDAASPAAWAGLALLALSGLWLLLAARRRRLHQR